MIGWPVDLSVYAGLVVLFLGHAWLAGKVTDAERKHTLYFGLGLVILWFALETPIDTISDYYLDSVHMLQHVLLGFVAPPLRYNCAVSVVTSTSNAKNNSPLVTS